MCLVSGKASNEVYKLHLKGFANPTTVDKGKRDQDETPAPRRIIVRPPSEHSRPTSYIVPHHITSTHPSPRISYVEPSPRPSQYLNGANGSPGRTSVPRIIQATDPTRRSGQRIGDVVITDTGSPKGSYVSMHRENSHSRRRSRHGSGTYMRRSGDELVYIERTTSQASKRGHIRHASRSGEDVVIIERSRSRARANTTGTTGERVSNTFLTATVEDERERDAERARDSERNMRILEGRGQQLLLEDNTRKMLRGRVVDRQRVLVEDDSGRRREYYALRPSS